MSALATAILAALAGPTADGAVLTRFTPAGTVAVHAPHDLDGDGQSELLLVTVDGRVRVWSWSADAGELVAAGAELALSDPDHSALAIANVLGNNGLGDNGLELVVLDRRGTVAYRRAADGGYAGEPVLLAPRARIGVRLGRPTLVDFVRDVNADGRPDLTVPSGAACELWLSAGPGPDGIARFDLAQTLPVELVRWRETKHPDLSARLSNHVEIDELDIADLNGDGRPDLRVEDGAAWRFHLQDSDGHFADEPIEVDLAIFRDTTPRAELRPGEMLVLSDEARMQTGDLNGDEIPDYVVAHRRKVWSFLATGAGPQFTQSSTRLVAEDTSGMLLVHLDDDDRQDLLIFKIELPTTAELVFGLVRSFDIEIRALGYPTQEDGTFATRARWKRALVLRVPSLMRLLREADDLAEEFKEVIAKYRWSATGDFDGDGVTDLALVAEDETAVELWRRPAGVGDDRSDERWLRELLFENADTVFDVERILKIAAQIFDARTTALTGGDREPDGRIELPALEGRYLVDALAADLTGDGAAELVLVDESTTVPGERGYTAASWSRD